MGYKPKSDSYLMSMTKEQIIEHLRVAEHNFFVMEEALNNSAKAGQEIAEKFDKAKELLKAAVEDINWLNEHTQDEDGSCIMRTNSGCSSCPLDINGDLFCKWKHNDEALKLIEKGEQNWKIKTF